MKFLALMLAFAAFATLALASANNTVPTLWYQRDMPTEPVLSHVYTLDHEYPHVHFTETVFSFPIMGLYLQFFERVDEDAD